jgi:hypothetical protein
MNSLSTAFNKEPSIVSHPSEKAKGVESKSRNFFSLIPSNKELSSQELALLKFVKIWTIQVEKDSENVENHLNYALSLLNAPANALELLGIQPALSNEKAAEDIYLKFIEKAGKGHLYLLCFLKAQLTSNHVEKRRLLQLCLALNPNYKSAQKLYKSIEPEQGHQLEDPLEHLSDPILKKRIQEATELFTKDFLICHPKYIGWKQCQHPDCIMSWNGSSPSPEALSDVISTKIESKKQFDLYINPSMQLSHKYLETLRNLLVSFPQINLYFFDKKEGCVLKEHFNQTYPDNVAALNEIHLSNSNSSIVHLYQLNVNQEKIIEIIH